MKSRNTYFKKIQSFAIFIFLVLICSCSNDDKLTDPTGPPEPVDTSSFNYPFTIGTKWNYNRTYSAENIRPDSIRHYFSSLPLYSSGMIEIVYDTLISGFDTMRVFTDTYTENTTTFKSSYYYTNNEYSMVSYAYRHNSGGPGFPYRPVNGVQFEFGGIFFSDLRLILQSFGLGNSANMSDSLIFESVPVIVLKYPIKKGTEWIFKDLGTVQILKKYLNFENLSLDTARISAIKTQRIWTDNNDMILYDYHTKYGQLKRDYLFKNVQVTNQFGFTIGYVDYRDVFNVISFQIAEPPK